uniref:Secreted protein n=1 Tax=Setaria viridis TaxID=4556 RepID=A0A4U6VY83_SETVI|nr:hypothetical protein SEVIR_2G204350v2 [Setaria viridis]
MSSFILLLFLDCTIAYGASNTPYLESQIIELNGMFVFHLTSLAGGPRIHHFSIHFFSFLRI